ncbi:unnamed protein product [Withania somnifera]
MALSSQVGWQCLSSMPYFRSRQSIPLMKAHNSKITKLGEQKFNIASIKSRQRSLIASCSMINPDIGTGTFCPFNTIEKFYSSINNKDLNQLALLISEDCFFDDFSFPQSFQGRKEALKFLEQLTRSMGQNTEISIDNIYEGVDLTAIVNWHLEWKKKEVPFSRGCSYYELSRDGEQLLIKNAQVITESSMKPKIMALLNMITSEFNFTEAAERFAKNNQVAYQLLLNTYKFVLQPFISPILVWYKKLWTFAISFLGLTTKFVQFIIKNFKE